MADEFPNLEIAELMTSDPEFADALEEIEESFCLATDEMMEKAAQYREEIRNA